MFIDSAFATHGASTSFAGGLGFTCNTTLNDELGTSMNESHRQMVFTAAHRTFSMETFGIPSLHKMAFDSPMKSWPPSMHTTCESATMAPSLSNCFPSRDGLMSSSRS